jgi:hypothetical protein
MGCLRLSWGYRHRASEAFAQMNIAILAETKEEFLCDVPVF